MHHWYTLMLVSQHGHDTLHISDGVKALCEECTLTSTGGCCTCTWQKSSLPQFHMDQSTPSPDLRGIREFSYNKMPCVEARVNLNSFHNPFCAFSIPGLEETQIWYPGWGLGGTSWGGLVKHRPDGGKRKKGGLQKHKKVEEKRWNLKKRSVTFFYYSSRKHSK